MTSRDQWVDYAKGIGIVLVVYGHTARGIAGSGMQFDRQVFTLADSILYTFHIPLFFFLSGLYFISSLEKYGTAGVIAKKADALLYPYVLWSLLQGTIEVLLSNYTNGNARFLDVLAFAWRPRAQFWFLYVLFLVSLASAVAYARKQQYTVPAALCTACVLFLFQELLPEKSLFRFFAQQSIFFAAGVYSRQLLVWAQNNARTLFACSIIPAVLGQWYFHAVLHHTYTAPDYPLLLILSMLSIMCIIAFCMILSSSRIPWLGMLGASSLAIFVMHILAGSGARIILKKIFGIENIPVHLLLGTLSGILIPLGAVRILRTYNITLLLSPPAAIRLYDRLRR